MKTHPRKAGTLKSDTNYRPRLDYSLKEKWLTDLWANHKVTNEQCMKLSVEFRTGHAGRKRDILEVIADEKRRAVHKHIKAELGILEETQKLQPRRPFPQIDLFVCSFLLAEWRRPIYVIVGGTGTGKSILAATILREVGAKLGLKDFLEITVEGDAAMDLSDFDLDAHSGVLLDGVADVMFLHHQREALQGRAKVLKGGRSATMMYSYPYTLCKRAVVVTLDLAAKNLRLLKEHHWLSDARNVCTLWLDTPAWQQQHALPAATQREDARATMGSWSVAEVCAFLERYDLDGPCKTLRGSGVRGKDLLEVDQKTLISEVGLTLFAAKRVLEARESFLHSDSLKP